MRYRPRFTGVVAAIVLLVSGNAQGTPVEVTETVLGYAGAWTLDFAVTNDFPSDGQTLSVYLLAC